MHESHDRGLPGLALKDMGCAHFAARVLELPLAVQQ
jgi:hypothetical protein